MYRGVTPVKSLGRVVKRRLARNREKAANWSGRIGNKEWLTAILLAEQRLNRVRFAELPPEKFGKRFHEDPAGHAGLARSTEFTLGVSKQLGGRAVSSIRACIVQSRKKSGLLRKKTFQVVFAEGIALYSDNMHGLARLPCNLGGNTQENTKRLHERGLEARPALQRGVLKFDASFVLVQASANGRRQLWLVAEQTPLPEVCFVFSEDRRLRSLVPTVQFWLRD